MGRAGGRRSLAADVPAPEQSMAPALTKEGVAGCDRARAGDDEQRCPSDPSGTVDLATSAGTDPAPFDPAALQVSRSRHRGVGRSHHRTEDDPVPVAPAPVDAVPLAQSPPPPRRRWKPSPPRGRNRGEPIATAYIAGTGGDGAPCLTAPDWGAEPLTVLGEGEAIAVRAQTIGEWQPVNCAKAGGYVNTLIDRVDADGRGGRR